MIDDFGIIIACCDQDYYLVKGCCASIRHFLGDVPICLIIDGDFSVDSLKQAYGVQTITPKTVQSDVLRKRSFGWGITKMIAFWESPWEKFLFLDSDTMVWGNVLKYGNFDDFDLIIDKPNYTYSDEAIEEYFFHVQNLEQHFSNFDWRKHRSDYFCTGTYFARRNIFPLEQYIEMLDFVEEYPNVFSFGGEMSFLNLMMFQGADEGKLRLNQVDMQVLGQDFSVEDLKSRFPIRKSGPVVQNDDAYVIHWAGPKPWLFTSKTYSEPMTFFRQQFASLEYGLSGTQAKAWLFLEDQYSLALKYKKKVSKKLKKWFSA